VACASIALVILTCMVVLYWLASRTEFYREYAGIGIELKTAKQPGILFSTGWSLEQNSTENMPALA
jgi:hypothetical protein